MTWLTEAERDPRPAGDRLARLWSGCREPTIRSPRYWRGRLDRMQTRRELYELIGYDDYEALDDAIARSVLPDERANELGGP